MPSKSISKQEKARLKIRNARLAWLFLHVYGYGILLFQDGFYQYFGSTEAVFAYFMFAVVNATLYTALQRSNPGMVPKRHTMEKVEQCARFNEEKVHARHGTDLNGAGTDIGVDIHIEEQSSASIELRHCEECNISQPLRTKHCEDCNRCIPNFDHHCICAGVCIGKNNHRLFFTYTIFQTAEAWLCMGMFLTVFRFEWSVIQVSNVAEYFALLSTFLVNFILVIYHSYLIWTNQTSWEHAKRSKITYLKGLPHGVNPFSQGGVMNTCSYFTSAEVTNTWTYAEPAQGVNSHEIV